MINTPDQANQDKKQQRSKSVKNTSKKLVPLNSEWWKGYIKYLPHCLFIELQGDDLRVFLFIHSHRYKFEKYGKDQEVSSRLLGETLKIKKDNIHRMLNRLEKIGLIKRTYTGRGRSKSRYVSLLPGNPKVLCPHIETLEELVSHIGDTTKVFVSPQRDANFENDTEGQLPEPTDNGQVEHQETPQQNDLNKLFKETNKKNSNSLSSFSFERKLFDHWTKIEHGLASMAPQAVDEIELMQIKAIKEKLKSRFKLSYFRDLSEDGIIEGLITFRMYCHGRHWYKSRPVLKEFLKGENYLKHFDPQQQQSLREPEVSDESINKEDEWDHL